MICIKCCCASSVAGYWFYKSFRKIDSLRFRWGGHWNGLIGKWINFFFGKFNALWELFWQGQIKTVLHQALKFCSRPKVLDLKAFFATDFWLNSIKQNLKKSKKKSKKVNLSPSIRVSSKLDINLSINQWWNVS